MGKLPFPSPGNRPHPGIEHGFPSLANSLPLSDQGRAFSLYNFFLSFEICLYFFKTVKNIFLNRCFLFDAP